MRFLVLGVTSSIALAAAVAGPVHAETATTAAATEPTYAKIKAEFEEGVASSPGGPLFTAIKRLFPDDYEAMVKEMILGVASSDGDTAKLRRVGFDGIKKLYSLKMAYLVNAPDASLVEINRKQLALVKAMEPVAPEACAQYVETGFDDRTQLPPDVHAESVNLAVMMLEAAKLGSGRPHDARRGSLDDAVAGAWYEAMLEIDPSEELISLMSDDGSLKGTPEQRCRLGALIYGAINALPPEQAANMSAYLLAESLLPAS